jgi:hypothetical protein
MPYSPEQLKEIESLAALFFSKTEIEIIVSTDNESIDNKGDFDFHYQRGQLKQMALLRKSIFEQATNGSSPAQALAFKIIDACKINQL